MFHTLSLLYLNVRTEKLPVIEQGQHMYVGGEMVIPSIVLH